MIQLKPREPGHKQSRKPIPKKVHVYYPQKSHIHWGDGAGDKAGRTARSLSSLLSLSKSHTFLTLSPNAGFYMRHISCRSIAGWMWKHSEEVNFLNDCSQLFRHLWVDMLQGQRVSKAQSTSFQLKFQVKNFAITLLLLYLGLPGEERATLDNRQDSLNTLK